MGGSLLGGGLPAPGTLIHEPRGAAMLALTRRTGERLVILTNPPVVLTLAETSKGKAKLMIQTGTEARILREEIAPPGEIARVLQELNDRN